MIDIKKFLINLLDYVELIYYDGQRSYYSQLLLEGCIYKLLKGK